MRVIDEGALTESSICEVVSICTARNLLIERKTIRPAFRYRPRPRLSRSLLTVGFAFGQTVSPILASAISDTAGSIVAGFGVAPVLLGIAACVSLLQRPPTLDVSTT
jgi:hypothetical protein